MTAGVLANCVRGGAAVFALAVLVLGAGGDARAQGPSASGKTIWDGIYTQGQSERGRTIFVASCGRCHNDELVGSERGPALSGDGFWQRWDNDSFDKLFTKVRDTMPQQGVESLSDVQKADALSYVLAKNGAPAGPNELSVDLPELEGITIVRKGGGTGGVSNFNLVQVVGCLSAGANGTWSLTQASNPTTTRDESADAAALTRAAAVAPGTMTFQLVSVLPAHRSEAQVGQKVEARGLLYRSPTESLLNLTALRTVAPRCQ
jgi:mono/diheme cytochrome c family protein